MIKKAEAIQRQLNWVEVPIDDIQPYANNPKEHMPKQIEFVADLIKTYGWTQPICLDKNYEIIFGHCRYRSAKLLEEKTVPCVFREDLTEAEAKSLRLADNKSNESEWIEDRLNVELVELQAMDVQLEEIGFDMKPIATGKIEEDDFDVDGALEEEPITQVGDLWLLGKHKVLAGDSTKREDVECLMDGEKADMVFTDPPYGVGYEYAELKDDPEAYPVFAQKVYGRIMSLNVPTLITVGYKWNNLWFKFEPDGFLIWFDKTKQSPSAFAHLLKCELMLIFGKFPERFKWDIFEIEQPRGDGLRELHPCPKPLALYASVLNQQPTIRSIIDLFLGSGTTLIAAEELGRICVGLEICPQYVDVTVKRYINHVGHSEDVFVVRDGKRITWRELT